MPRTKMTDEERAAKHEAKAQEVKAKREADKAELRQQIEALASKLPPHAVQGGVQVVRGWKDSLDEAIAAAGLGRVSVDRLTDACEALRRSVEA